MRDIEGEGEIERTSERVRERAYVKERERDIMKEGERLAG